MEQYIHLENKKKKRVSSFTKKKNIKIAEEYKKYFKKDKDLFKKIEKYHSPEINYYKSEIIKKVKLLLLKQSGKKIKTIKLPLKNNDNKFENKQYIEISELGKGGFGICYLYESVEEGEKCAAKIVEKKRLTKDKSQQNIINEIKLQQSFDHPKIVKVKNHSEDNDNVYILLELCENQTLEHLLQKRKNLSEIEVQCYIFQLIQGVKYLHNKNIIHRDLKPNNIFLDKKLEIKIGDFGLVAKLNNERDRRHTQCGTPHYMAPEIIGQKEKGYSFEVDIWSIGIIMYKLLTGILPFYADSKDPKVIYEKILNDNFVFPPEPKISEVSKDLIRQILVKEPKKRPGLNQIIYHDFFHIGKIPKYPSISTLEKKPSIEEIRKFWPNADENGIVNIKVDNDKTELYKLIVDNITEIKYEDIDKYIVTDQDNNKVENYITLLHKSHYGFYYYELNNNLKGIIFKKDEYDDNYEGIRLLLNEKTQEFYEIKISENEDEINKYNVDQCPENLASHLERFQNYIIKINKMKKEKENKDDKDNSILTLETFSSKSTHNQEDESTSIMDEQSVSENGEKANEDNKEIEYLYIKKFTEHKYATFILLSDGIKQIIFKDKVEIFIIDKEEEIEYVDRDKKRKSLSLINAMKNSNKDLNKRLRYIKQVNFKEVKEKINKKINMNRNNKKE